MARLGRLGFLGIAVLFHVVYIYSIFDIYFVSPVTHGMTAFKVQGVPPPAKRLFLFVGDGLRADKAFQFFPDPSPGAEQLPESQTPRPLAPYLRSKILNAGTFGVSHTRVPTESRPGHVALIAGLYEDVSAVTTGWKLNPVEFDSVFNRSRHTWSWGSPDILPMFAEGATPGRVDAYTYGAELEDFSKKDATALDLWVFDGVKAFFQEAKGNATLAGMLKQDKNVFFLHLLGLDTTGHSARPYSREYLHNIKVVDKGVREIAELAESYFGDDQTAFVFTADHGMSDWGSHGDGHPDNTRTPLIVWGSGVAKPKKVASGIARGHEDGFSSDWQLDHIQRNDVAQADVATLMAYLVGLEFPVNSVGELPLEYLSAPDETKAEAMLVNARGILEMYRIKELEKQAKVIRYKAYPGFADSEHSIEHRLDEIRASIDDKRFVKAMQDSDELMKLGLDALRYLQTYDWLFLRTLVTAGYLGWIAFSFTVAVDQHVLNEAYDTKRTIGSTLAFTSFMIALFSFLYVQSSPLTYYAYAVFPVIFWEEIFTRRDAIRAGLSRLFDGVDGGDLAGMGFNLLVLFGILELMDMSYYHREMYTVLYLLAVFWPFTYGLGFLRRNFVLVLTWSLCCIAMSVFTLLPAIKIENNDMITSSGVLMAAVGFLFITFEDRFVKPGVGASSNNISRGLLGLQLGLTVLAILVTRSSVASLQADDGLPLGNQVVGWAVFVASLILPFAHSIQPNKHYLHRLMVLFLAFSPMFIILTLSYEGFFYIFFAATLVSWMRLETRIPRPNPVSSGVRILNLSDLRTALFFFFLLQSGFFSTGNIASLAAFSLEAVARLIPVFDPFSQAALLLLKILTPFILVSANLGILSKRLRLQRGALFTIVTGLGDWLTLRFFWAVRDEGSWLEIGESISVFCIASGLCVFVAALEMVSEVLVGGIEVDDVPQAENKTNGHANVKIKREVKEE